MNDNISLRKMKYFLTVAQCGNIVKAAEQLHVTQPLLSKALKELEADTGIALFSRLNRKLELTEAGEYIFQEWKRIFDDFQRALNHALMIQNKRTELRIGLEYSAMAMGQTPWMVRLYRLRKEHPEYKILTISGNIREIIDDLLEGRTDLTFCTYRDVVGHEDVLSYEVLQELPEYLYTGSKHPFHNIQKDVWSWSDFKNERFMTIDPKLVQWPYQILREYANEAGFEPQLELVTDTQLTQVMELRQSTAFMLSIEIEELIRNREITACRLPQTRKMVMAWRTGEEEKVAVLRNALSGL